MSGISTAETDTLFSFLLTVSKKLKHPCISTHIQYVGDQLCLKAEVSSKMNSIDLFTVSFQEDKV